MDDATSYELEGYDLCYCGCTRAEHDPSGRCHFCEDCESFEYDHDATCVSLSCSDMDDGGGNGR